MHRKSRKEEYAEATRAALVEVARAEFAERGYADVSIEQIVQGARVTRGALYHHFEDKRALFRAVLELTAGRARTFFARAAAALPAEERRRFLPAEIMSGVYQSLLGRIERRGYDVFTSVVRVPRPMRASGPMMAPGSISTPSSMTADGEMRSSRPASAALLRMASG